jgi:hypothetical protein
VRIGDHERAGEPRARKRPAITEAGDHDGDRRGGVEASLLRLQRTAGNAAVGTLIDDQETSPVLDVVGRGGGTPLDSGVRSEMEQSLGGDFSSVRVHTDGAGDASARAVGAEAYTVGEEIVFRDGRYDPAGPEGKRMLAHELAHVEQQRSGPVDGSPAGGGIALSDPGDRFELAASAAAERVGTGRVSTGGVQRATGEEEMPVGAAVQRATDEDELPEDAAVQRATEEEEVPEGAPAAAGQAGEPLEEETTG